MGKIGGLMALSSLQHLILDDESLTRGLGDEEARLVVEWLVEQAESCQERLSLESGLLEMRRLCRRLRAVCRFVWLWCYQGTPGAACQLAASERFAWPLPGREIDPFDLMNAILEWEEIDHLQRVEMMIEERDDRKAA